MRISKLSALAPAALLVGAAVVSAPASRFEPQTAEPPGVVAAVAPAYPAIATVARASSDVIVEAKVNNAGEVSTAKATSGHPLLQQAAQAAARRWKFEPSAGSNDPRTVRLTFVFKITEEKKAAAEVTPVFFPPYKVEITHAPAKAGASGN